MRSVYLRLNNRGQKGPKSMKPYKVISQLGQFQSNHKINWDDESFTMTSMIDTTLSLLGRCEDNIQQMFGKLNVVCNGCGDTIICSQESTISINTDNFQVDIPVIEY